MTALASRIMHDFWWLVPALFLCVAVIGISRRRAAIVKWFEARAGAYADKHMPPSDKAAFERRIARRVRWLRLKDRWKNQGIGTWLRRNTPRPLGVFAIFATTLALAYLIGVPIVGLASRVTAFAAGEGDLRGQTVLLVLGIPIAFILWWFRDMHVAATLENQRKDVNLKEFQEIQMRAAGAMDETLPASARETLQIAATHQLAGFLRGEYGESFQRPAWELLRAKLLASSQRMGYQAIPAQIEDWRTADVEGRQSAKQLGENIREATSQITQDNTGKAQRDAVRDEWRTIFSSRLPLPDTVLDGIALPRGTLLAACDLSRCSFVGARLWDAHLEGADLWGAHLEGADLWDAHLEGADLWDAHLEGANLLFAHLEGAALGVAHLEGAGLVGAHLESGYLGSAHLEGANLGSAHLEGAYLGDAHLEGANLEDAHLEGADLEDAHLEGADLKDAIIDDETVLKSATFDDETQFSDNWAELSEDEKTEARAPWIERGMIHVNDRK